MTPEQRIRIAQRVYGYPQAKITVPEQFSTREEYEEAKIAYWEHINISNISPRAIKNQQFGGKGKNELMRKFNDYVNEKMLFFYEKI